MATAVTTEHAFQKCVELLRKLHDLIGAGQDESDEAETLRAQMDPLWHSMSEAERERIRGLSEDFYLMREGAPRQVQMLPDEKAHWSEEAATVLTRMLTGMEADAALKFLRKPMPADQPRYVVPFMKARCWERLGEMELALLFLEEAVRLDSHQAVCVLILLLKHGRREEAAKYAERIIDDKQSTGEELYQAAVALFLHTRRINPSQARPIWSKVVSVLERALRVFLTTPRHEREVPFADVFIFAMLGFVHRLLGSRETALRVYDEGLARYPTNATLLTLRGLALTDTDPAKALSDFRAAVQAQGRSMW